MRSDLRAVRSRHGSSHDEADSRELDLTAIEIERRQQEGPQIGDYTLEYIALDQ